MTVVSEVIGTSSTYLSIEVIPVKDYCVRIADNESTRIGFDDVEMTVRWARSLVSIETSDSDLIGLNITFKVARSNLTNRS